MAVDQDGRTGAAPPPEVEAEIVAETPREAGPPPPPGGKSTAPIALFPGLIVFFVFVAAALGAFLIWRLQAPPPASENAAVQAAQDPPAAAAKTTPSTSVPAPAAQTNAAPAAAEAAVDPGKIANSVGTAKAELSDFDLGDSLDPGRGLPPAPPAGSFGNSALQDAAKEAQAELMLGQSSQAQGAADAAAPGAAPTDAQPLAATEPSPAPAAQSNDNPLAVPSEIFAPTGQAGAAPAAMENELASLRSALDEERRVSRAQADELEALKSAVGDLFAQRETAAQDATSTASDGARIDPVKFSLALLSLNRAIDSGKPFEAEYQRIARLAPEGAEGLAILKAHAPTGVPTETALKAMFADHARAAIAAERREKASGVIGAAAARIASLISVRPADPQEGSSASAVISRAEARTNAGDIAGAAAEIAALQGGAAEAFAPWTTAAKARLEASAAAAGLGDLLLAAER